MFCWHIPWSMMWFWHKSLFLSSLYANLATKSLLLAHTLQSWGTASSQTSHKSMWFYLVPFSFSSPFFFFLPRFPSPLPSRNRVVLQQCRYNCGDLTSYHHKCLQHPRLPLKPELQSVLNLRGFPAQVQVSLQSIFWLFRQFPIHLD